MTVKTKGRNLKSSQIKKKSFIILKHATLTPDFSTTGMEKRDIITYSPYIKGKSNDMMNFFIPIHLIVYKNHILSK